jgi:hypothetical protein
MKFVFVIIVSLFICSCGHKDKPQGVNFAVMDKTDTLSHFYYEGHEKYQFYSPGGVDTLFSDKNILTKIPGQFKFGIKDRVGNPNRFLVFSKTSESPLEFTKEPRVPFLGEELITYSNYSVELFENYIDSTNGPVRKYETYVAIDRITKDTIIFQEVNYMIYKNNLLTSYIVYDNPDTREEMRLVLDDAKEKMKESVKDKIEKGKN